MKKKTLILFCAIAALSVSACSDTKTTTVDAVDTTETVQIPNPFTDCATLSEASAKTGFDFSVPDSIDDYQKDLIQTMDNEMIQVFYSTDSQTEAEILLRKSTETGDISGDYNDYPSVENTQIDSLDVTLKGDGTSYSLALFEKNGYSYSIYSSQGLDLSTMEQLVQTIQ